MTNENSVQTLSPTILGRTAAPAAPPASPAERRLATAGLLAAVVLGILGDALLHTEGLGINLALWVLGALIALAWLERERGRALEATTWAFAIPVVFFASTFAWRATEALDVFNMLAMLSAFGLLAISLAGWPPSLVRATLPQYVLSALSLGFSGAVGGPLLVVQDGGLTAESTRSRRGDVLAIARGLLIALPLLLIFGALLTSADQRFADLIDTFISIDVAETAQHIAFAGFVAWVTAGYVRAAIVARRPLGVEPEQIRPFRARLGIVELAVPLALLDLLFLAFVILQLPYLFGGAAHVQQAAGLTVAEYARHGFFELVVASVLVLPVLLGGAALVRREGARDARVFAGLAAATLVLVAVMMLSALQRMSLYAASFGLTEDRIYATAIMVWLVLVFSVFAATSLRGRPAGFTLGAIVAAWFVVAALDAINPQAIVVRTNTQRAAAGAKFDAAYVASLGPDATPALVAAAARVPDGERCTLLSGLDRIAKDRDRGLPTDWRWWNASRVRAFQAAHRAAELRANLTCRVETLP